MAISSTTQTEILKIVVGLFNAAPGQLYMTDMANAVEGGLSTAELSDFLAAHPIFTEGVMAGKVTTEAQTAVLMSNFGLTADDVPGSAASQAEEYFADRIDAGDGFGAIVYDAVQYLSGSPAAEFADVAALLTNKALVAAAYSEDNSSTDLAILQAILSGVTATGPSTPEEISAYLDSVVTGDTFTLTSGQDTVVAGAGRDTIKGIFGSSTLSDNTLTAGDDIDGGSGSLDTLELTAQGITASPGSVTVSNVERITINDSEGATFNALSVVDDPSITFNGTANDQTSTVTNGALGSVMGLSGKGNLTVNYADTSGAEDIANVSLGGTGTDEDDRSTVNVSDGNTIEELTISTTGTNFVTLAAGNEAAAVTITGDGTNNFDVSGIDSLAGAVSLDASLATGDNTFNFGIRLNSTDTVKGGSGDDTVNVALTSGPLLKPTMTGVETLEADMDVSATIDLTNTDDLETVTLYSVDGDMKVTKADATVTTLNIESVDAADYLVDFYYASAVEGDLTMNVGLDTVAGDDVNLGEVTIKNADTITMNFVGDDDYDMDDIELTDDVSSITITSENGQSVTWGTINATGSDIGALTITAGEDTFISGNVYLDEGDLGDVTVTYGQSGANINLETDEGSIGDVTVTGEGHFSGTIYVSGGGDLGDISLSLDGFDASGSSLGVIVSGGSIGDITLNVANGANLDVDVSGNHWDFDPDTMDGSETDGNIGNITLNIGDQSYISANFQASGGDIGDLTIAINGDNASGNVDVNAIFVSGDTDNDSSADDYVRGGNVGDIAIDINGDESNLDLSVQASGGNIGDVVINMTGNNTSGYYGLTATQYGSGSPGGNIGTITLTAANNEGFELDLSADGEIGEINITAGDDVSGAIYLSGGGSGNGLLNDVTVSMGDDAEFDIVVSGFGGDVSDVSITALDDATVYVAMSQVSGDIGLVDITTGDNGDVNVFYSGNGGDIGDVSYTGGEDSIFYLAVSGGANSMGSITLTGGDVNSSAGVYLSDTGSMLDGVGGIFAEDWEGALGVDVTGVDSGVEIHVGQGDSDVWGSEYSDLIYLGGGEDTIHFDTTPTSGEEDAIESFTTGVGGDILDVINATVLESLLSADTVRDLVTGDIQRLVDIAGGEDITTEAGLLAALDTGGEYDSITVATDGNTATFITATSSSATTWYVFEATETDTDSQFDSVTLIGVVNADGGMSSLVLGNFS